jgi:hypothetical protein
MRKSSGFRSAQLIVSEERLVRDRNTPQKVVWRARIVLLASDGLTAEGIEAVGKKPAHGALASPLRRRGWRVC